MRNHHLTAIMLLISGIVFSQVGIGTTTPAATMDITAKNATGATTNVDGLLVPRVDRQRAQNMTAVPVSTMIYVNGVSTGAQTGTSINIDQEGYYYFDGAVWIKLNSGGSSPSVNLYNTDGTLTGNRVVTQGANTLAFNGTATNAFSVEGSTLSVDAANNNVGIGTTAPNTASSLELSATDKGLLLTRISLASTGTWGLTGTSVAGMTVYNTNAAITSSSSTNALSAGSYPTSVNGIGLYTWDGFGWVPQNSAAEVMKIPFPTYPVGASSNGAGGSTATGVTALPLNNPSFNTISGATVTPASGAVFLPKGTYRIGTSISIAISGASTNNKYLQLIVSTSPTGTGDVHGLYTQPSTMAGLPGYINGNSIIRITNAAGANVYFTVFVNGLNSGDTWVASTASPQSYATIERLH
ncbi:hypothetical protein [Chryseobacterium sp. OSA05B]|uniref:hypothetical protein n=1 Tax=Chryseobacterium sp. OSA05B TaxID=2862650 RepID=UPI001CBFF429|nr:hypothetical protein [Chryseobacterium sp. OSA05B]